MLGFAYTCNQNAQGQTSFQPTEMVQLVVVDFNMKKLQKMIPLKTKCINNIFVRNRTFRYLHRFPILPAVEKEMDGRNRSKSDRENQL